MLKLLPFQRLGIIGLFLLTIALPNPLRASDPPSHDPSNIVKEGDTYYVFTTGDGIWNFSSTDPEFQSYSVEDLVYTNGSYESWIDSYVSGFGGTFWAPGIIYMNGKWHLYYSCSTFGSQYSTIGLTTTTSLANRNWEDQGMVVYSINSDLDYSVNAIDAELFRDQNDSVWMLYGSYWDGIVMTNIDTTTGKPVDLTDLHHVANSSCEAAGMMYYDGYYYLFFTRGQCCNGINSSYRIYMGRSEQPTGPFYDKDGVACNNGGGSIFMHGDGQLLAPGHFGYLPEDDIFSFHYYDGWSSLYSRMGHGSISLDEDGWALPVVDRLGAIDDAVYLIENVNSEKAIYPADGNLVAGTNLVQYTPDATNLAQRWQFTYVGRGDYKIVAAEDTSLCMEIETASNNAQLGTYTGADNQLWTAENIGSNSGSYTYRFISKYAYEDYDPRYLEIGSALTADGDNVNDWTMTDHACQTWNVTYVAATSISKQSSQNISVFPNPTAGDFTIRLDSHNAKDMVNISLFSLDGKEIEQRSTTANQVRFETDLPKGVYLIRVSGQNSSSTQRVIIQ